MNIPSEPSGPDSDTSESMTSVELHSLRSIVNPAPNSDQSEEEPNPKDELGDLLLKLLAELKLLVENLNNSEANTDEAPTDSTGRNVVYNTGGSPPDSSIGICHSEEAADTLNTHQPLVGPNGLLATVELASKPPTQGEDAERNEGDLTGKPMEFSRNLPHDSEHASPVLSGGNHSERYNKRENLVDLNNAISSYEQALKHPLSNTSIDIRAVCDLIALLRQRYERLGDWSDLTRAFECLAVSANLPNGLMYTLLGIFGVLYIGRFTRLRNPDDIDQAIRYLERAVPLAPDDKTLSTHLNLLGNTYECRFEMTGEINDLNHIISLSERVVALSDHSGHSRGLADLGNAYLRRFNRTGSTEDLNRAIECLSNSIRLSPTDDVNLPARLVNLARSLQAKYDHTLHPEDLDYAIECQAKALEFTPSDHSHQQGRLGSLGGLYFRRYEHFGKPDDIEWAIECLTQPVLHAPNNHPDMPDWLVCLGNAYCMRFGRLGDLTDIEKSVELLRQAIQSIPIAHVKMPLCLDALGMALRVRFEYAGELSDVYGSIECLSRAASLTPGGDTGLPYCLSNLAAAHIRLVQHTGHVEDIDRAIEYLAQAAVLWNGMPKHATALMNLGSAYEERYQILRNPKDLDLGMQCRAQSVELTPEGHADLPQMLTNLCKSFAYRFEITGNLDDIYHAIGCCTRALNLVPINSASRGFYIHNLGCTYGALFRATGDKRHIDEAVTCLEQAIVLYPEGHAQKPQSLMYLGILLGLKFDASHNQNYLDKAIEVKTFALAILPEDHPKIQESLSSLGESYMKRFKYFNDWAGLIHGASCFKRASQSPAGNPQTRFVTACRYARLISQLSQKHSLETYQVAIDMIPQLIWLGTTVEERYKEMPKISDLIQEATSVAIQANNYQLALEWLEQGRSVVWNQMLQLRSPLDDLSSNCPELAERLREVTANLHNAGYGATALDPELSTTVRPQIISEQAARMHRSLAVEYERLITQVRHIPGFEDFMIPTKAAAFFRVAENNPVVIINAHESRCDALAILPGDTNIHHIPLPNMTYDIAQVASRRIRSSPGARDRGDLRGVRKAGERDHFKSVLATLWTDIVKPILEALGYMAHSTELPHITWCMTGPFSFLPIHAAGYYDRPMAKLSDYAISSYTPTLTALLSAGSTLASPISSILAVSQETTPNKSALPQTVTELAQIKSRVQLGTDYMQLSEGAGTVSRVLEGMEAHSCVHLACHASQNLKYPTESGFHLQDGTLTLRDIVQRQFHGKQLAFLSACQTAAGDELIPDEAAHLASGMLMAGYPSVIATMWSISDRYAPLVAEEVYARLLNGSPVKPGDTAKALHYAVARLREEVGDEDFIRWVPYVHIGI